MALSAELRRGSAIFVLGGTAVTRCAFPWHVRKSQRRITMAKERASIAQQGFLYYDVRVYLASGEGHWRSLPYRILKRTPKYVYVASTPYVAGGQAEQWGKGGSRMIRLNRQHLEQWGYAFVSFGDVDRYGLEEPLFYKTPSAQRARGALAQQDCFAQLELTPPYTVDMVKRAYRRLAMQHHPDRGGAASRFLALQNAYRQALDTLSR
jgi:hypothetical protein